GRLPPGKRMGGKAATSRGLPPNNALAGRQVRRACLRQVTRKGGASGRCCSVAPLGMALIGRDIMAAGWVYTRDGDSKTGPFSFTQFQAVAQSGQLLPTDMVWQEGTAKWVPASAVEGLQPAPHYRKGRLLLGGIAAVACVTTVIVLAVQSNPDVPQKTVA